MLTYTEFTAQHPDCVFWTCYAGAAEDRRQLLDVLVYRSDDDLDADTDNSLAIARATCIDDREGDDAAVELEPLWIFDCRGATTEEVVRGVRAAQRVFSHHGVTAAECNAAFERIANDDFLEGDFYLADIWDSANTAAIDACCEGWYGVPESAHLEYQGA